jgi:hypothetical protein
MNRRFNAHFACRFFLVAVSVLSALAFGAADSNAQSTDIIEPGHTAPNSTFFTPEELGLKSGPTSVPPPPTNRRRYKENKLKNPNSGNLNRSTANLRPPLFMILMLTTDFGTYIRNYRNPRNIQKKRPNIQNRQTEDNVFYLLVV